MGKEKVVVIVSMSPFFLLPSFLFHFFLCTLFFSKRRKRKKGNDIDGANDGGAIVGEAR